MDFAYRFPAVKGFQAGKEFYIAMIPLRFLSKLFGNDDEYVPPEYRAQRRLNTMRIPVIKDYILENRDSYVFSALAASIDGEYLFSSSGMSDDVGVLEISMDAHFVIVDGQHRKASIIEAIHEDETLNTETISIVFYDDKGLKHSQQMFTDLNKHAVKTSNSIAELYDSRDPLAVTTINVIDRIDFLKQYTDKEKDILGKFSSNFFTLNTFYKANKKILSKAKLNDSQEEFLFEYWSTVAAHIVPWLELYNKEISKVDLREKYIVTQAIIIQALGCLGNYYAHHAEADMATELTLLEKVDWSRNAECWKGRVVRPNGKIVNSTEAAHLACNIIKQIIGIPLSQEDQKIEEQFQKVK